MRKPNKTPRTNYCTGCGVIYPSVKALLNHRKSHRCGGRFLTAEEYINLMNIRRAREAVERELRSLRSVINS